MSTNPAARQLPPRPSLEQLRKQAKELAAAESVPLSEAQFRLARSYGFDSWPKLAHHVESLRLPALAQFERLAADGLAGYRHGDAVARERFASYFGIRILSPQTLGARLKDELGITPDAVTNPGLSLADTQAFVARAHGFETWTQLAEHMSPKRASGESKNKEPPYRIDWQSNRISPRHALTGKDWDEIVAVLAEEQITGLDAGGQMTDDVLEKVSQLEHVTHLALGGSDRLTDDGFLAVARMRRLEHLGLGGWHSSITDRGLRALGELRELKELHACWSQKISDAGIANLKSSERLEVVDLMGTTTGDGTLAALAGKPRLRVMKIGRLCTDDGLRHLRDFPVFRTRTWESGEAPLGLMSFGDGPNHLLLDGPITKKGLAMLADAGLEGLFGINLFWHVTNLAPNALEPLARIPNLELLGCKGELADDAGMRHIAAMPRLRVLMAQGSVAGDDGFAALSRSPSIQYIWGRECPKLKSRGFASLANMPALKGVAVSCTKVDDAALSTLPNFPALEQLLPMDVSDDGFRHVGRCEKLVHLWCMYCRDTGDVATGHIAGLTRLESYYAGNTKITDRSMEILGGMTSIEKLEFWQCARITDAGLAHIARLPRLREVEIGGSPKVTRRGMDVFPATVKTNFGT